MRTIGAHMSTAKGLARAAQNTADMRANTMQIFSRNPRGSVYKNYSEEEIERFWTICRENHFGPLLAHAPYTMNLASGQPKVYEFGCSVIREDAVRMETLGLENMVFHPGSHTGIGKKAGIQKIIGALNQAAAGTERIHILLETMSGKGTEIGSRFEELKAIRDGIEYPERVGVCFDTCHVFAAGYDIVNSLDAVLDEFDRVLGLKTLRAVHLNDSMMPFDSHKDRHAPIGEGKIGLSALLKVLSHPALKNLPFYLETPFDDLGHEKELRMLKEELSRLGEE